MIAEIYNILNSQMYRITFSPTKESGWLMYCNNHFIGGVFDDNLCFIYTEKVSEFLAEPEPVYYGYSKNATHKMLICPIEKANTILEITYKEHFENESFVCDISSLFKSYNRYPNDIKRIYELYILFLNFCYENKLLKYNPLDDANRILHFNYVKGDLTEKGKVIFEKLHRKCLAYTDRTGKIENLKMLNKYYLQIESEE